MTKWLTPSAVVVSAAHTTSFPVPTSHGRSRGEIQPGLQENQIHDCFSRRIGKHNVANGRKTTSVTRRPSGFHLCFVLAYGTNDQVWPIDAMHCPPPALFRIQWFNMKPVKYHIVKLNIIDKVIRRRLVKHKPHGVCRHHLTRVPPYAQTFLPSACAGPIVCESKQTTRTHASLFGSGRVLRWR